MNGPEASKLTIARALENVGDREQLANLLGVEVARLNLWILGREVPPHDIFLRALDLAFQNTSPVAPPANQVKPPSPREVP